MAPPHTPLASEMGPALGALASGSFKFLSGANPVTQFGTFGIANRRMVPRPTRLLGCLFGPTNSGKTTLLASCPGALIINLERSSTPISSAGAPPLPAQFWPGVNEDGEPIGPDGKRIELNWASIVVLIENLVKAAKENQPRPQMVVFDSLTQLIYSILHKATLAQFGKEEWADGRGDAMWEWLNQQIAWAINSLRDANYGVWFVAHLATYMDKDANGGSGSQRSYIQCHPGFIKRFWGQFELCLGVEKTLTKKVSQVVKPTKLADGRMTNVTTTETTDEVGFVLMGEALTNSNHRRRIPLPKAIVLPEVGGWAEFEKQYMAAAQLSAAPA